MFFIEPKLEYEWRGLGQLYQSRQKLLEAIQIEDIRIVTGATKVCSIGKLYHDKEWGTLEALREKQKNIIFFKMVHGLCRGYLNQLNSKSITVFAQKCS